MAYEAEISRSNPTCFLFLIDQSGSMSDPVGDESGRRKADALADALNRLLMDLCIRCTKDAREGVRDYYEIGVIGYGAQGGIVGSALGGALSGRELVRVSELAASPLRVEVRRDQERERRFPVWVEPVADDGTPMCAALRRAYAILNHWVAAHPRSFPPIVINITDGQPTDGDPEDEATAIRQLATQDGQVLLFNLHISETKAQPCLYPEDDAYLPDDHARLLFRMSSILPPHIVSLAQNENLPVTHRSRGFVFNAPMTEVVRFLNIGTRPKNLR
jgi:hypothetical protein